MSFNVLLTLASLAFTYFSLFIFMQCITERRSVCASRQLTWNKTTHRQQASKLALRIVAYMCHKHYHVSKVVGWGLFGCKFLLLLQLLLPPLRRARSFWRVMRLHKFHVTRPNKQTPPYRTPRVALCLFSKYYLHVFKNTCYRISYL